MKKFVTKFSAYVIIIVMLVSLIPGVALRWENEHKNNVIVMSLLYNDLRNKVSPQKLDEMLVTFREKGTKTITVMEEDINALVARGDVTCIKYNVLNHKYDDESMEIAKTIGDNYPQVGFDSYIFLAKKEEAKKKLALMLPLKYSDREYVKIDGVKGMDVYAFFNGRESMWNITLGFDEDVIKKLSKMGYDIAFSYKVKNYSRLEYLEYIDKLVAKYNVKYFNIKTGPGDYSPGRCIKENYKGIARIINDNDMTLVVTENIDQLSNQKCYGYNYILNSVFKKDGSHKIMRSFETYDDSQDDGSHYLYRVNQYFHSTIDRNIRFITVTQIAPISLDFEEGADYTIKAVEYYKDMMEKEGYIFDGDPPVFKYATARRFNAACCAVIGVMFVLLIMQMLSGKRKYNVVLLAMIVAAIAALSTAIVPMTLIKLYPSVYNIILSCFAMTVVIKYTEDLGKKYSTVTEILMVAGMLLLIMCAGALGMLAMLSGIDYYMNNEIFRGIKISLIMPVLYTAIAYYFVYINKHRATLIADVKKALVAEIKVYWVIVAGVLGYIGLYYIIRSGNVKSISSIEEYMRTTIETIFPQRPRTKEFLIGYPSLILFVYYARNTKLKLVQWFLAVGSSILAASMINSFCHVFTDMSVIYLRVINGVIIGAVVCVFVYVANLVLVRIVKHFVSIMKKKGLLE